MKEHIAQIAAVVALALVSLVPSARAAESPFAGRGRGGLSVELGREDAMRRAARSSATRVSRSELEQVLVVPQRPGRTNVRYYDFDWRRYDFLDDDGVGGVRFYFYEREEKVARVAAAIVREQYEELARRFDYRPTAQVPYILYNSHREFQNTNAFFISEGVLGVTSPRDLRMALPFWGEIRRFQEVSLHEMVHQFTIQKVAGRAAALGLDNPVMLMPLWFIEGIAEWYSKGGVDPETDVFARDLLLNARPTKGYALVDFWADSPKGFVHTYKLGQLRVAFLAEQYGERIIQAVLDQSARLDTIPADGSEEKETFKTLVARLAKDTPEAISSRFEAWLKRKYLPTYLATVQEPPAIGPVNLPGEPDAFSVAPDGHTLVYRSVERDTGRSRIFLADRRDEKSAVRVAVDGVPGVESLHPVLRGVTAITDDKLAFFARDGVADALYVVSFSRRQTGDKTRFSLGKRRRLDLSSHGLIEAGDPVFSPEGDRVAFFALDDAGRVDLWVADLATGDVARLTNDAYAERDLTWSNEPPSVFGLDSDNEAEGTLIFTTDRTSHGYFNLVAMDPRTGATARLTDEEADHRGPRAMGDGRVVFSTDSEGKPDLHVLDVGTGSIKRVTDFVTGLTNPTRGPSGLMALGVFGGRYQMFDVPEAQLLSLDERPARRGESAPPRRFAEEPIPLDVPAYEPLRLSNWRLENGAAAVGTASVGQGALLFSDELSDRSALVQLSVYGSLSLTDALVFYADRSGRSIAGAGVFHTFTQRRDPDAPGFDREVLYLQREFGLTGLWAHPFDTFKRLETRAVVQGVDRTFQFPFDAHGFPSAEVNTTALRAWQASRGGLDLETLLSVRFGYDTTRYRFPGGAFGGGSLLVEVGGGYLPLRHALHRYATFDGQYHLDLFGSTTLHFRAAGGWAGGSVFGRQFFLSSYDNLRMYGVNDQRLLGTAFAVANVDFEVPLDQVIALAFVSNIKGLVGADFGGVADGPEDLWNARALAVVLGANIGLGPFEVRVHFARPFDINPGRRLGPGWMPNLSLRYAYF